MNFVEVFFSFYFLSKILGKDNGTTLILYIHIVIHVYGLWFIMIGCSDQQVIPQLMQKCPLSVILLSQIVWALIMPQFLNLSYLKAQVWFFCQFPDIGSAVSNKIMAAKVKQRSNHQDLNYFLHAMRPFLRLEIIMCLMCINEDARCLQ